MQYNNFKFRISKGFSLVEVVFAATIFAVVAMAIFQGFISVNALIAASRDKVTATDLMNGEFELIRNLSYADVGLTTGLPHGVLQATTTVTVDGKQFNVTRVIRDIDDPFDGTIGGSPNDLSPADYKLVEVRVVCSNCKNPLDFSATAHVAPKNLETTSTNGALFINVFDANGQPVPQAQVHVENQKLGISFDDETNNDGLLAIVNAPPAQNSYRIIASKSGFTTDRTYATSTSNPNPLKLDATVLLQQLTQTSFIIDKTSTINVRTMDSFCTPVPNVSIGADGTKLIGSSPNIYKWSGSDSTDGSGFKSFTGIEWDVYSFKTVGSYLAGTNPISPISILPNSTQNVDLIISSESPSFLLVNVKDASTGLPLSGANVTLSHGAFNQSLVTDRGFFKQTDWSGGAGQTNFVDPTRYYSSDGNIDTGSPTGELKLVNSLGSFVSSGEITSSVFDTGTSSNWSKVDILPTDQPPEAGANSVRFQIATSPSNTATTTWNFLGPDGTSGTFYTISNNNINAVHNGDRYLKYKIFLTTSDPNFTPNVSDFAISFSSSCIPPGQALFFGLSNYNDYTLDVSAPGFTTQTISNVNVNSNWQKTDVSLSI
jgi:prepilin-type N-terminal cleavage/methylation domain-containing protein